MKVPALPVPGDGDPAKVDWSKASTAAGWRAMLGNLTERQPVVRLAHDGKYLYVQLAEPCDTAKLVVGGDIWSGDDWEIFFVARRDKLPYRQLCVGPEGKTIALEWTKRIGEAAPAVWDSGMKVVSDRSNNCWTVAFSFPLEKLLPGGVKAGDTFCANFMRVSPKPAELLAWSPHCEEDNHMPEKFGELTLE